MIPKKFIYILFFVLCFSSSIAQADYYIISNIYTEPFSLNPNMDSIADVWWNQCTGIMNTDGSLTRSASGQRLHWTWTRYSSLDGTLILSGTGNLVTNSVVGTNVPIRNADTCPEYDPCPAGVEVSEWIPSAYQSPFCFGGCEYLDNGGIQAIDGTDTYTNLISTGEECSNDMEPANIPPFPGLDPDGSCPDGWVCQDENGNPIPNEPEDLNKDGTPDRQDSDDDGIPDDIDLDDDNDGIADYLDTDDNNDGTPDIEDQDRDGIPDHLDPDDNNDGLLDIYDQDGDGIHDDIDHDDDNDGISDDKEDTTCPDGLICPDDGICQPGEDPASNDCGGTTDTCPAGEICPDDGVCQAGEDRTSQDCRGDDVAILDFTPLQIAANNLGTKFPASIGSSLVSLFDLVDVSPVAPSFNIEFPAGHFFTVSLSVFDPVVTILRWLMGFALIGFTITRIIKLWSGSNA